MDAEARDGWLRAFTSARVVTAAMLVALLIYAALVQFYYANGMAREPGERPELLRYLFYGLAAATLLAVRFVRLALLQAGGSARPPEQRLLTAQVVTGALIEASGLFGFTLFLLTGLYRDALVLIGLGVVMMAVYFPRAAAWESFIAEQRRETGRG